MTDRVALEFAVPVLYRSAPAARYGVGNVSVGLKWRLNSAASTTAWVAGFEVAAPTRTQEIGEDSAEVSPWVGAVVRRSRAAVHARIAWARSLGAEPDRALVVQGAVVVPVRSRLALLAEVQGVRPVDAHGRPKAVVAPGLRLSLRSETSIGFAVPLGIDGASPPWGMTAQLQHGWESW